MKEFFNKIFTRKNITFLGAGTLLFAVFFVLSGIENKASADFFGDVYNLISSVIFAISNVIIGLAGMIFGLITSVLGATGRVVNTDVVNIIWTMMRDLVNMTFLFSLLLLALAKIIGLDAKLGGGKIEGKILAILIGAFVINFTKVICGVFVDVSQLIMMAFVSSFQQDFSNLVSNLTQSSDLLGSGINNLVNSIFVFIFAVILLGVGISILAYVVIRMISIAIYTGLSPLLVFYYSSPFKQKMQKINTDIWKPFMAAITGGPILGFYLWVSLFIISAFTSKTPTASVSGISISSLFNTNADELSKNGVIPGNAAGATADSTVSSSLMQNMIPMVFSSIILIWVLSQVKKLAVATAGVAGAAVGKMMDGIQNSKVLNPFNNIKSAAKNAYTNAKAKTIGGKDADGQERKGLFKDMANATGLPALLKQRQEARAKKTSGLEDARAERANQRGNMWAQGKGADALLGATKDTGAFLARNGMKAATAAATGTALFTGGASLIPLAAMAAAGVKGVKGAAGIANNVAGGYDNSLGKAISGVNNAVNSGKISDIPFMPANFGASQEVKEYSRYLALKDNDTKNKAEIVALESKKDRTPEDNARLERLKNQSSDFAAYTAKNKKTIDSVGSAYVGAKDQFGNYKRNQDGSVQLVAKDSTKGARLATQQGLKDTTEEEKELMALNKRDKSLFDAKERAASTLAGLKETDPKYVQAKKDADIANSAYSDNRVEIDKKKAQIETIKTNGRGTKSSADLFAEQIGGDQSIRSVQQVKNDNAKQKELEGVVDRWMQLDTKEKSGKELSTPERIQKEELGKRVDEVVAKSSDIATNVASGTNISNYSNDIAALEKLANKIGSTDKGKSIIASIEAARNSDMESNVTKSNDVLESVKKTSDISMHSETITKLEKVVEEIRKTNPTSSEATRIEKNINDARAVVASDERQTKDISDAIERSPKELVDAIKSFKESSEQDADKQRRVMTRAFESLTSAIGKIKDGKGAEDMAKKIGALSGAGISIPTNINNAFENKVREISGGADRTTSSVSSSYQESMNRANADMALVESTRDMMSKAIRTDSDADSFVMKAVDNLGKLPKDVQELLSEYVDSGSRTKTDVQKIKAKLSESIKKAAQNI